MSGQDITPAAAIALLGGMAIEQAGAAVHADDCAAGERQAGATPIPDQDLQAIRKGYRDQSEGWWRDRARYHREAAQAVAMGASSIGLVHALAKVVATYAAGEKPDKAEVETLLERAKAAISAPVLQSAPVEPAQTVESSDPGAETFDPSDFA